MTGHRNIRTIQGRIFDMSGAIANGCDRQLVLRLRENGRAGHINAIIAPDEVRQFEDAIGTRLSAVGGMLTEKDTHVDASLSGYWKPRFWTNQRGERLKAFEFIVSEWTLGDAIPAQ